MQGSPGESVTPFDWSPRRLLEWLSLSYCLLVCRYLRQYELGVNAALVRVTPAPATHTLGVRAGLENISKELTAICCALFSCIIIVGMLENIICRRLL